MRALGPAAARRCETAKHKTCKCRCHGALHGALRHAPADGEEPAREFFEQLPEDDPHHVRSEAEKRARRKTAKPKPKPQPQPVQMTIWEALK